VKVCVIGQGYVGLPLAIASAQAGNEVTGIDTNQLLVANLNNGFDHIEGQNSPKLKKLIKDGKYRATIDFNSVKECNIVIICVPTPLDSEGLPDLQILLEVTKNLAHNLTKKILIIYESTVAPGTIRGEVLPILMRDSKLSQDDLKVAYSPERIDPSNSKWNVENTPKLVAGISPLARSEAITFYEKFIKEVISCESIEVAETAKLLENSFRLLNISFVNELSVFCNKIQIDVNDVIKAASSKPYGFMPFYPGLGAGGHCIPVDPIYLFERAKELSVSMSMIEAAKKINNEMPKYFVQRAKDKIGNLSAKKILVLGLAYKPNVSDIRETPAEPLIKGLRKQGAIVAWHDDLVREWNGEKSVDLGTNYDLAILATPHDYFDLSKLGNVPILNTRGSL
jgi:UDP-N-acetyl-D-glucosamine dehydrogenase